MLCIDSYVERLLDRISNGKLAEDRRSAMIELQAIVAESRGAQLAFGAMGECFSLVWYSGLVFVPWLRFIIFFIYFCRLPCNVGSLKGRTWWPWNGGKSFFPIYLYTLFFLYFQFYHSKKYILREKKLRTELWLLIIHIFLIYLPP